MEVKGGKNQLKNYKILVLTIKNITEPLILTTIF